MELEAFAGVEIAGNGHVDRPALRQDLPERSRGPVADHRVGPRCQDRRHPATALSEPLVPDGVDAPVDLVQAARLDAPLDRLTTEAERVELRMGNDSVLTRSKRGDERIDTVSLHLSPHSESKCRLGPNSPPL